ncbi:putative feruloyl esterase-like protein 1 [Colletotrichum chlorophyti]|uniref:Carboxylic ester hydrolase n=1 Tax=Colletotrichum chlorophyti TaxID=708187 RepID=A0A1Q8S6N2_9PEZI|nr:putative feruloyl esterase-like protein 1 [Colletotrichum chlorophyti]
MKGLLALLTVLRLADVKVFAAQGAKTTKPCSPDTFDFPRELEGADPISVSATEVRDLEFDPKSPEGRAAIPKSGVSFCNVTVKYAHTGCDDTTQVQVWLPSAKAWNGRFVGVGGGGYSAGQFGSEMVVSRVAQGYAGMCLLPASATDAGHDHRTWQEASWALNKDGTINERLLVNYAHVSVHEMTIIAKALVAQYYGTGPKFSYWSGCSTGGRQGIVEAQRYPADYDGILSGAPAVNQPSLIISTYWPQFVMNQKGTYPHICELILMNKFAVEACDELDGVKDNIITNPDVCHFDPMSVVGRELDCGDKNRTMSAGTAEIAREIWRGPHGEDGKPLWLNKGYPVGASFTGQFALGNTNCSLAGERCFGQPFQMSVEWIRNLVHKDPNYDVKGMRLADLEAAFDKSRAEYDELFGGNDPDLSEFRSLGNKMISWHGLADECVTMRTSRDYYDRVLEADQGASSYYRHFEAPGVNHCYGLTGTFYPLKGLETLRAWVEDGKVPDVLDGFKLSGGNESEAPTRPLCRYPAELEFMGGDSDKRESWGCERKVGSRTRCRDEL